MDREDWLYVGGSLAAATGCALIYAPYGLLCLGACAVGWPFVSRMLSKGPKR